MDGYEIPSAYVGISKLMYVGHACAGNRSFRTLAATVITQTLLVVEAESRFPHHTLLDADDSMRTVVVMNRRFLAGPPTNDQHLDGFVTTNAVAPVIAFLKPEVRSKVKLGDLDPGQPRGYLLQRRRLGLAVELFYQLRKGERTTAVERFGGTGDFGVELYRQELGSERKSRAQVLYSLRRRESRSAGFNFLPDLPPLLLAEEK